MPTGLQDSAITAEELAAAALAGDEHSASALYDQFQRYLLVAAARRARDLPEDLHEEITHEVWLRFYQRYAVPAGTPITMALSVKDMLRGELGHAVDAVRSAYREPGRTARRRNGPKSDRRTSAESSTAPNSSAADDAQFQVPDDKALAAFAKVDATLELEYLLRQAPEPISAALEVVYSEDASLSEAAERVGIKRLQLQRWVLKARQKAA